MVKHIPFFLAALVTAATGSAHAESYGFLPGMSIDLGKSWNPSTPNDVAGLGSCIDAAPAPVAPVASEQFSEGFIDSYEKLESDLRLDYSASADARYGIAKASVAAKFDALRQSFHDDRKLVYVVSGKRTYAPRALVSAKLSADGREAADSADTKGDSANFYKPCGQTLVTSVKKSASINLVYIFRTSNASLNQQVKAAISQSASAGPGNNSKTSGNMMAAVRSADSSVQVTLTVVQSGLLDTGPSVRNLVGLEPGDMSAVRVKLKEVVGGIDWVSASIESFTAERMDSHFSVPPGTDLDYVRSAYSKLDNMRAYADQLVARHFQINDALEDSQGGLIRLRPGAQAQLTSEITAVDAKLEELVDKARDCLKNVVGTPCSTQFSLVPRAILKYMDVSYGEFSGWKQQLVGNQYNYGKEQISWTGIYWPEFRFQNKRYVREIRLVDDSEIVASLPGSQLEEASPTGIFSFKPYYTSTTTGMEYCWNAKTEKNCMPWAASPAWIWAHDKGKSSKILKLRIVDIEGGETDMQLPPLSSASF